MELNKYIFLENEIEKRKFIETKLIKFEYDRN